MKKRKGPGWKVFKEHARATADEVAVERNSALGPRENAVCRGKLATLNERAPTPITTTAVEIFLS